ncbi:MAG: hypothetical protein Q8R83_01830 [Legionellaceae bacterium]|nr:hypothetical protein [Legionellaceae bacterium]
MSGLKLNLFKKKTSEQEIAAERSYAKKYNRKIEEYEIEKSTNIVTKFNNAGKLSANFLISVYNSEAFKSWQFKLAMALLAIAAALVIFALTSNVGVPAAIATIVAGLTPFMFNLVFGAAIAVAATSTALLAASFSSTGGHIRRPNHLSLFVPATPDETARRSADAVVGTESDNDELVHGGMMSMGMGMGAAAENV